MSRIAVISLTLGGALVAGLAADHHVRRNFLAAAGRVVLAEAVLQHVEQAEILLADEAVMACRRCSATRSTTAQMPEAVVTWIADHRRPAITCG